MVLVVGVACDSTGDSSVVTFTGDDCTYSGPDLEAGLVEVTIVNSGEEEVEVVFLELSEGVTFDEHRTAPHPKDRYDDPTPTVETYSALFAFAGDTVTTSIAVGEGKLVIECAPVREVWTREDWMEAAALEVG